MWKVLSTSVLCVSILHMLKMSVVITESAVSLNQEIVL